MTSGSVGQWQGEDYIRTERSYQIPDVTLRDRHDKPVHLPSVLDEQRPVVLQFIFTSCQSVCPMLTAMTAQAQDRLREIDAATRIISISIDPDYDTPQRLYAYASQFGASGDWKFLTGDRSDILLVLSAFNAMYDGQNKMNHKPYTFMRAAKTDTWVRLIGLPGASKLSEEYRSALQ
ncbi:MAG: SCO family protein [Gammaproteobacteria bacterium]|nr:SCO family protein [Gammaproteobacteria bacterium]